MNWKTEPLADGWLLICWNEYAQLAHSITRKEWREAHDQSWLFWNRIECLRRNMVRVCDLRN